MKPQTKIHANGSKWIGQQPDSLEMLFERLKNYTLIFYAHIDRDSTPGRVIFRGNFEEISGVFDIDTNVPETIKTLQKLFLQNPGYNPTDRESLEAQALEMVSPDHYYELQDNIHHEPDSVLKAIISAAGSVEKEMELFESI